ncbi:serpin-ZX [Medicago truncatula]|uniref:serpin-ZX n=1 Tax=Medicago truncatula TaxID=3880 RepID=UPI00196801D1|nr:serpin-ZX-like [Medicago truncatula]
MVSLTGSNCVSLRSATFAAVGNCKITQIRHYSPLLNHLRPVLGSFVFFFSCKNEVLSQNNRHCQSCSLLLRARLPPPIRIRPRQQPKQRFPHHRQTSFLQRISSRQEYGVISTFTTSCAKHHRYWLRGPHTTTTSQLPPIQIHLSTQLLRLYPRLRHSKRRCSRFKRIVSNDFKNKAVEVNNEVNLWAERETNGLIKELLPLGSVDYFTQLIFANALYFKGEWNDNFDASETNVYDFHLLNGNSVKVDFMTSDEKKQFIRDFDDFKVLGLPYKQGEDKRQFTMYFFLPNAKDGLPTLLEKLASESELLQHKLPLDKVEVGDFRIPRFNISFELETSDMLKELGVVLPFTNGGLTKMVNSAVSQNLYVSKIFHKSFIEVNEEGTKAAAATAGLLCGSSLSLPTDINFVADHPFLFIIREDLTGTIVFVGQVLNPLAR